MTNRDVFGCVECLRHEHECPDCIIVRLTRERDEARETVIKWEQSCLDCKRHDLERHLKQIIAAPGGAKQHVAIEKARKLLEAKP